MLRLWRPIIQTSLLVGRDANLNGPPFHCARLTKNRLANPLQKQDQIVLSIRRVLLAFLPTTLEHSRMASSLSTVLTD
jgi:hypothetical protein